MHKWLCTTLPCISFGAGVDEGSNPDAGDATLPEEWKEMNTVTQYCSYSVTT